MNVDPPAIIRSQEELRTRCDIFAAKFQQAKQSLTDFLKTHLGELASLKASLLETHGAWSKFLKRIKLSRPTAERWLANVSNETFEPLENPQEPDGEEEFAPTGTTSASQHGVQTSPNDQSEAAETVVDVPAPKAIDNPTSQSATNTTASGNGHPSGSIESSESSTKGATGDKCPTDEVDAPIPAGLIPVFESAGQFREIINTLNATGRKIDELANTTAGALLRVQQAKIDLKNLKETIRFDMPFAVCPVCVGLAKSRKSNCPCKDRGWLNKGSYENLPAEYRQ